MSNNKDFKVKNGIKPTAYHEAVGTVVSGSEGYYLDGASYDGVSASISQSSAPYGVAYKSDGTIFYFVDAVAGVVYQYALSTAWDVSTMSYASKSLSVASQDDTPLGLDISADGTKLYIVGAEPDTIYQYTLSTAYDVSTGTYASKSFSIGSQTTNPRDLFFKSDGTKMYVLDYGNTSIFQYTLSTAWDVSTASYDSVSFNVSSQTSSPNGISISQDGKYVLVTGVTEVSVFMYTLSTLWDLSTASYTSSASVSAQDGTAGSAWFKSDGTKMYYSGLANDTVYQYSTALTTASLDLSTGSVFDYTANSDATITLSNPADSGTVSSAMLLLSTGALTSFNIGDAVYDSVNGSVTTEATSAKGFTFKSDGTKMYVCCIDTDYVYEYDLSTAWDVSTLSYSGNSVLVSSQDANPYDLAFSANGDEMYMLGRSTDTIYQYTVHTPWDVSTASYKTSFSVTTEDSAPTGMYFKPDGTKFYMIGQTGDSVDQYSMSTPWELSTASYDSVLFSVAAQETIPWDVSFNNTGTKMFITGRSSDDVHQYSLSTAWDVSTASYDNVSFYLGTQNVNITGLYFNPDGTKMYMLEDQFDSVHQYTVGTEATFTLDTNIEWTNGVAPDAPSLGQVDVIFFSTRDGGTTYQAMQVIDGVAR